MTVSHVRLTCSFKPLASPTISSRLFCASSGGTPQKLLNVEIAEFEAGDHEMPCRRLRVTGGYRLGLG
jgi:hypothetical protein